VKPNYTSILGAVLTDYPSLGRDQTAAAVIGLRAMEAGNAWLEVKCRTLASSALGFMALPGDCAVGLRGIATPALRAGLHANRADIPPDRPKPSLQREA